METKERSFQLSGLHRVRALEIHEYYKYLGMSEEDGVDDRTMKGKSKKNYLKK